MIIRRDRDIPGLSFAHSETTAQTGQVILGAEGIIESAARRIEETIVPLGYPPGSVPPMTHVRTTMLVTSLSAS